MCTSFINCLRDYILYLIDSQTTIQFTLENLCKLLSPLADKWRELGEILSVTEDNLDEIFTNNKTDEACLQEMLRFYLMRSDLQHDWEEVSTALRNLGEETLANKLHSNQHSGRNVHDGGRFKHLCNGELQSTEIT